MIYPTTYEQKIGFDQIRSRLTALCLCSLGEGLVRNMAFAVNFDDIRRQVKQTMEFVQILQEEDFPDQNFFDVRPSLKRIRIQNACLDVEELFDLQRSLATIDNVVKFLQRCQDEENTIPSHPYLYALTADVKTYPMLVRRIDQILDKYGHVKDTASPTLLQIRRELAATAGSVSRALQNILKSAKGDGLIDKDVSPTLRDGRLVIPVAPAMKRKIRGIVHDESDTGRTVFIEPAEVVEANNKIRELENEERKEINRILMEFTQTVRPEVEEMLASYEFLAQIDFIRAKAKFAILTNSTEPRMENRQVLDWAIAVHPLLELRLKKKKTLIAPSDSPKGEGNRPDGNTSPLGEDGKGLEGLLGGSFSSSFVRLKGQTTVGQILKISGNEATVVFGQITTNVKLSRLEPAEAPKKEKNVAATFVSVQTRDDIRKTTLNFKEQLDVRGMRGDEAVQAVTYFIDDALVARASRVKILHGTGTGALKTVIRQYLNTMPPVADFYDEDIRFGGAGITIVELV